MRYILPFILLSGLLALPTFSFASVPGANDGITFVLHLLGSSAERIEQGQGCCSHHGGECGCSAGHDLCCDGSVSPSCGC